MKDTKSLAWLLPAAGLLILVVGWFLGRQGWEVSKLNPPGIELVPPTTTVASQIIQPSQPANTPLPATITAVQPSSRVQLVSSEVTGKATRKIYNVTLASDEVIVGDAYDFQDKGYKCVVFIIRGPGTFQFAVLDGAWYRYSGVESDTQAEELLQARVQYLQNHWFCKNVAFPVERIGR